MKPNRTKKVVVAVTAAFLVAPLALTAYAAKGDQGIDVSGSYQSGTTIRGYASDKFAIAQVGGYYNGSFHPQNLYATQVQYGIAQGVRMHTYIYGQFSGRAQADRMLNYYLPKVQTPKNSIVMLDVESGSPDTDSVIYALNRIKQAGYTPVLYGYKSFLVDHLDLATIAKQTSLAMAEYPNYQVTTKPNYNFFPSYNNIGIFQFTSTYKNGGLDGDVDLTGITDNGYKGTTTSNQGGTAVKPDTSTPAILAGQEANNTPKSDIKSGDTVKVNFSASKWVTGQSIPSFVKGVAHKVLQVSGNRVLLDGVLSWANKSDVEILSVGSPVTTSTATNKATNSTGTFNDSGYTIHRQSSTFTANQTLRVFAYPGVKATGARYYRGESVKYDGYVRNGNYIYVSYLIKGGYHHYVAVRHNGVALGSFK